MMDNNQWGSANVVLELSLTNILSVVKPSEEDREKRLNIISNLTAAIRSLETLRDATVEPFGSFVSNLYTKWGDLDISVELSNTSVSSIARSYKQKLLREIFRVLRKGGVRGLQYIPNARVPILIFQSKHTISCDLSVNNLLGQVKSKYFLWITEIDERFRDLVLLVKEWAKAQNINNPKVGTLNSYSLCLLVIFHLQTCRPAILPPLKGIFEGNVADYLTGSGPTAVRYIEDTCATNIAKFKLERRRQVNWSSLTELFVSFFKKFSNLKTMSADHAICTYTGQYELIRSKADWVEKHCQLIIEDPFEQPENAARAVGMSNLTQIVEAFDKTCRKVSSPSILSNESLIPSLFRPHICSALGIRIPQAQYRDYGDLPQEHHVLSPPLHEHFRGSVRLDRQQSSSSSTMNSARQGTGMWRPM